ncbi:MULTISPECIES: hypothetical protein [unclassified Bradyrhizobium]|uniref:hypothetical protein n=1 Tax=unclassified Bradyrhizobium TaxID=2631580 RepID=UPI002916837B|nr:MULTISPECIES: hypothetical protein [unclassified Bradyrhizobium]
MSCELKARLVAQIDQGKRKLMSLPCMNVANGERRTFERRAPKISRVGRAVSWMTLRICALCATLYFASFDQAAACAVAGAQTGVLFDHIPTQVDAPVILEVTIVGIDADISSQKYGRLAVMNARVERVVKGTLDRDAVKVVTSISTCTRIGVGHGYVAGMIDHDALVGLELIAIQRSSYDLLEQRR